ncbi:unnamed protein product, partial [Effrenium voratum]
MATKQGRMTQAKHSGILKGGIASICVLLFLRLGSRPAWLFANGTNAGRFRGHNNEGLEPGHRARGSSKADRSSAWSAAPVAPMALLGGAAARRRRAKGPALAAAGDAEMAASVPDQGPMAAAVPDEGPADPVKRGGNDPIKSFMRKMSEDPEFQEDIKTFFTSLTVALMIRGFLVEPRFIPSLSMYPNFDIGDQLTVDKISKNWRDYQRRDVVVFNPPPKFNEVVGGDRSGEALIKRI